VNGLGRPEVVCDECGHDLEVVAERDGIVSYECRNCGAEVVEEPGEGRPERAVLVDGRTVRLSPEQREALKTFPAIVLRAEVELRRIEDVALRADCAPGKAKKEEISR